MKKVILYTIALSLLGCKGGIVQDGKVMSREAYLNSLDSTELTNGLIFWTSDTAFTTNAKLMLLLDTLYQHVGEESFPAEVKKEEAWMSEYRSKLCVYYQACPLGSDTISSYAKADSVLNEGVRLLELGNHWSTMEMVVYNSAVFTFDRLREYGLLTQVINNCENDKSKELVYQEWALYEKMMKKIGLIASNIVSLNSWGGSITGPLRTAAYLQISDSRMTMYKTLLDIMKGEGWDDTGVPLDNAERFLFDCCTSSIERIVKESNEFYSEYGGKKPENGFQETIMETKNAIKELRPIVKEWIEVMDKVDNELTHDDTRHSMERAASFMLMKWASITTEQ